MSLIDFLPVWLYCLQHREKEAKQLLNVFMVSFSCQSGVQSLGRWLTQAPQVLLAPFRGCAVSLWAPLSHFALYVFILSSTIFSHSCEAPVKGGGSRSYSLAAGLLWKLLFVYASCPECLKATVHLLGEWPVYAFTGEVLKGWNTFKGTAVFNLQQHQKAESWGGFLGRVLQNKDIGKLVQEGKPESINSAENLVRSWERESIRPSHDFIWFVA